MRVGNYVEDLAADELGPGGGGLLRPTTSGSGGTFSATTTSREAFNDAGKTGPALIAASKRIDIGLKYAKYGKSYLIDTLCEDKVPGTVGEQRLAAARRKRLEQEARKSMYSSMQREALEAAARNVAGRKAARPPVCRPKADGGQE